MKTKNIFLVVLTVVIVGAMTCLVKSTHRSSHEIVVRETRHKSGTFRDTNQTNQAVETSTISEPLPVEKTFNDNQTPQREKATASTSGLSATTQASRRQSEKIQDPTARIALGLVGADPDAEQYWISAINDPGLTAHERKDLIEDLNEDGLSDPHHPDIEDLPLILNRLQLIEELAPYAMDRVNQDAFMEAYKDLVNMLDGQPVR